MRSSLILAFPALAVATYFPALQARQQQIPCSQILEKDCGTVCIPLLYTCCPDQSGGCPISEVCWLGTNGQYGCCPIGKVCDGPGGVSLSETKITSTIVSTLTGATTIPIPEITTTTSVIVYTSTSATPVPYTTTSIVSYTAAVPTTTVASNNTATAPLPFTGGAPAATGSAWSHVAAMGALVAGYLAL